LTEYFHKWTRRTEDDAVNTFTTAV